MNIKISKFKILWKGLFGGKEAVFEYLLDIGNTAISKIPEETKEQLQRTFACVVDVRERIDSLSWLCPRPWVKYYVGVLSCIDCVIDALRDGKVEPDELQKLVGAFQKAYSEWRAD